MSVVHCTINNMTMTMIYIHVHVHVYSKTHSSMIKKQGNERTLNGNRKEDERMENGWHPFRCTVTYRARTVYLNGFLAKSRHIHVRTDDKSAM